MDGPAEAYVVAVEALATVIPERPFPEGINTGTVGDWSMALNASREAATYDGDVLTPWALHVRNNVYFIIAVLDPAGGAIGGISEDDFIEQMKALSKVAA